MTEFDATPEAVQRLAALVAEHGLTELTVEADGVMMRICAAAETIAPVLPVDATALLPLLSPTAVTSAPPPAQTLTTPTAPLSQSARSTRAVALESPMVGVFYRSASPDDPPFVVVGDIVKVGQPIGLIEAMKVFSEVPAEIGGRVVETPVDSGKLVQQGQPLIFVEPA